MPAKPAVQVLLSTWNGARFLKPQIDSVLNQEGVDVHLLVRDDGSVDETPAILKAYAQDPRVTLRLEQNIGVVPSYFRLISMADPEYPYFAFCDQDDVWLPDKLRRALGTLEVLPQNEPHLYCGRQILVDENLHPIGYSSIPRRPLSLANALVQNVATGITVVFNRSLLELLRKAGPEHVIMHDWWAYMVATAFGRAVYDPEPRVLYRQHKENVVGAQHRWIASWKGRIRRFIKWGKYLPVYHQVVAFYETYRADLPEPSLRIIERFLERRTAFRKRLAYFIRPDVYRQNRFDNLVLRGMILFNWI